MRVLNEWIGLQGMLRLLLESERAFVAEPGNLDIGIHLCPSRPLKRSGLYYPTTHVHDAINVS